METLFLRAILLLFCALFNIELALLLFRKRKEKKSAFHLALMAFFSGLYCFTSAMADLSWRGPFSYQTKLFWVRSTWLGILAVSSYLIFVYYFTKKTRCIKLKIFFLYASSIMAVSLAITTPYAIESVNVESSWIDINSGKFDSVGRAYFIFLIFTGLGFLLKDYFESKGFRKLQIKYLVVGLAIYSMGALIFAGILPLVTGKTDPYVDISAFLSSIWVGLTTYAIVRYQLMDIRIALGKVVSFLLFFATMLGGIFLLIFIYSQASQPPSFSQFLPLSLLLTLVIFQLNKFYEELTEIYFYPGFFKRKILVSNLEKELGSILEMETFSRLTTNTFKRAFGTGKIAVFVKSLTKEEFNSQKVLGFEEKKINRIPKNKTFLFLIDRFKKPFTIQELQGFLKSSDKKNREELIQLREKLQHLKIEVVIPLFFEKKTIGAILLGEKQSLEAFSKEDIEILSSFSRQASIALRNTLLYSEVKERKEELERFYRMTVEKEIKIEKLKKRVSELKQNLKEKD